MKKAKELTLFEQVWEYRFRAMGNAGEESPSESAEGSESPDEHEEADSPASPPAGEPAEPKFEYHSVFTVD